MTLSASPFGPGKAAAAADLIVQGQTSEAMNLYNTKKKKTVEEKDDEDTPV